MHWLEGCSTPRYERNIPSAHNLSVSHGMCAGSACTSFVRLPHGRPAGAAAGVPRSATARAGLCLDRGLLVSHERSVSLAQRLLDASTVSRCVLGGALLSGQPVLHGPLGRPTRR